MHALEFNETCDRFDLIGLSFRLHDVKWITSTRIGRDILTAGCFEHARVVKETPRDEDVL